MNNVEVFVVCSAESIGAGWVRPFTLARAGANGAEPFPIVIARDNAQNYFAFVNICPQERHPLYEGAGQHLDSEGRFLVCGKHGTKFQVETGICVEGPQKGARLESVPVAVLDGEVCLAGIELVEDEDEEDGPPEVMITAD